MSFVCPGPSAVHDVRQSANYVNLRSMTPTDGRNGRFSVNVYNVYRRITSLLLTIMRHLGPKG
jgi:hypothetical protein